MTWLVGVSGWLGLGLNLWGNLALAKKSIKGWIIRLACNASFIVFTYYTESWPLFWNHVIFAGINIYGWLEWSKDELKHTCNCGREWFLTGRHPNSCICELPLPRTLEATKTTTKTTRVILKGGSIDDNTRQIFNKLRDRSRIKLRPRD